VAVGLSRVASRSSSKGSLALSFVSEMADSYGTNDNTFYTIGVRTLLVRKLGVSQDRGWFV
jgi:hypothetical protein